MQFLMKWLRLERPSGAVLHPARTVEVDASAVDTFARCERIIRDVLGGNIDSPRPPRSMEASFGLVNSERLSVFIEPLSPQACRVTIQSRRMASAEPAVKSSYVEALVRALG